jgi:hypothetical protein
MWANLEWGQVNVALLHPIFASQRHILVDLALEQHQLHVEVFKLVQIADARLGLAFADDDAFVVLRHRVAAVGPAFGAQHEHDIVRKRVLELPRNLDLGAKVHSNTDAEYVLE